MTTLRFIDLDNPPLIELPPVGSKTYVKVAYMVARKLVGYPVVITRSTVQVPIDFFLDKLIVKEDVQHGQVEQRSFCVLLAKGERAFDLRHLSVPTQKVKDGVIFAKGATVKEAVQTYVPSLINKVLGVLVLSQVKGHPVRGVLYEWPIL